MMSIKPRPILQDMPEHIKTKIVSAALGDEEKFTKQRSDLRLVCKSFKAIVDTTLTLKLSLNIFENYICINKTGYKPENSCFQLVKFPGLPVPSVTSKDYVEMALRHLEFLTSNPKHVIRLFFVNLNVSINNKFVQRLLEILRSRQLKVKIFVLDYSEPEETVMKFLPFMDPAYLKHFILRSTTLDSDPTNFDAMVETEQWKILKNLHVSGIAARRIGVEKWWNVPEVSVETKHLTFVELLEVIKHVMYSPTFDTLQMVSSCFNECIERGLARNYSWETIKFQNVTVFRDRAAGKCITMHGTMNQTMVERSSAEVMAVIERMDQEEADN